MLTDAQIKKKNKKIKMRTFNLRVSLEVAYGSMSFFTSVLHNVFLLYHVDMFVSVYKIDKVSFFFGEIVFLFWNCINDPLFGWLSDWHYLQGNKEHPKSDVVMRRITALQRNGPLLALSFLAFWVAWAYPWLQFLVCMCAYDGFLTMVDLHHSAMLADLAVSNEDRTKLNSCCSMFSVMGSLSVFVSYLLWHKEDLTYFRALCIVLACISLVGYVVMSGVLKSSYARRHHSHAEHTHVEVPQRGTQSPAEEEEMNSKATFWKYLQQLKSHKNFLWFAAMNIVQVFHCHFNSNFFPLFLENLLGNAVSPTLASALLGISFVAPHINNLYFLTLCRRWGVYSVIRTLFMVKLCMAAMMFMLGPSSTLLLCVFIASNRVFTEGTCKLLSLVISDLVDEDFVLHKRRQAVSALIFGTSALLSKPGQSFAPLVGSVILSMQTGHDIFQSGHETGSVKAALEGKGAEEQASYRLGCFHFLVYITAACAVLQLIFWQRFSLRGSRLQWIKSARREAEENYV
ncbi:transmembrane protein 180-like isoform X2 [Babylonia areolata]|uniref:transmembrane protein 180-like isoform X2 n=1 Tax=Babylonia areolata TaxID=304850 RepID=UPI003FD3753A